MHSRRRSGGFLHFGPTWCRPSDVPPATSTRKSSCTPTRSRRRCATRSTRRASADAPDGAQRSQRHHPASRRRSAAHRPRLEPDAQPAHRRPGGRTARTGRTAGASRAGDAGAAAKLEFNGNAAVQDRIEAVKEGRDDSSTRTRSGRPGQAVTHRHFNRKRKNDASPDRSIQWQV